MQVILVSRDLISVSAVQGCVQRAGGELRVVASADAMPTEQDPPALVLIDLAAVGADMGAIVASLRRQASQSVRVCAFGPHVHEARLAAAREAGCDDVFSRGQLENKLAAILAELSSAA